jgi:hypothetical protein
MYNIPDIEVIMADKFALLKRVLSAIGLSEERVEELIRWVQAWLQEDEESNRDSYLKAFNQKMMSQ